LTLFFLEKGNGCRQLDQGFLAIAISSAVHTRNVADSPSGETKRSYLYRVQVSQELSAWGEVLLFLIGGFLFVAFALLVARFLRPHRPNVEKNAAYESGEEAKGHAWVQFNIRFYILALIFLLFEMELVFMLPWATLFADPQLIAETNGVWGWFSFIAMLIFVLILALGLAYAWVNGHLDWVKSNPRVHDYNSPVPKNLYDQVNERYRKKS
jgi:NADH-quinone oxidoreductase subunit A